MYEIICEILSLDNMFISKYENYDITSDNIDKFSNDLELYESSRCRLINQFTSIGEKIIEEDRGRYAEFIQDLNKNHIILNSIFYKASCFYRSNLFNIKKDSKLNKAYSTLEDSSFFIDITK